MTRRDDIAHTACMMLLLLAIAFGMVITLLFMRGCATRLSDSPTPVQSGDVRGDDEWLDDTNNWPKIDWTADDYAAYYARLGVDWTTTKHYMSTVLGMGP